MSSRAATRYFTNPYISAASNIGGSTKKTTSSSCGSDDDEMKHEKDAAGPSKDFSSTTTLICESLPPLLTQIHSDYALLSFDEAIANLDSRDPYAYEGYAGIAYAYHQLDVTWRRVNARHTNAVKDVKEYRAVDILMPNYHTLARRYIERSIELAQYLEKHSQRSKPEPPTFFCGTGGVYSTAVLIGLHHGDEKLIETGVKGLLAAKAQISDAKLPSEHLYGRAGYLHSLLLAYSYLNRVASSSNYSTHLASLKALIDQTFDMIISLGVQYKDKDTKCPLMYEWHGTKYLGAAHGVTGILYTLMQCPWRFAADAPASANLRALVLGTLNYCLSLRMASGNFPSSIKDDEPSDRLVQFCHGAPGLALACVKAYEVFQLREYIQPAVELGEVVWTRGLLKKGIGLCHGIGGNGYIFLKLYDLTRDTQHLTRASYFTQFALKSEHTQELLAQPDEPSSLGNGRGGFVCFAMDLLAKLVELQSGASTSASSSASAASSTSASSSSGACFPGLDLLE